MTGLDTRFLYSETPTVHMHTLKIVVIDVAGRADALTPEVFLALLDERLDRMPALRRRAVGIPYRLGHPVWIDDPDFDVASHVSWMRAPAPGGLAELAEIAARVAEVPLDRGRPLWDMTVIDGLDGGRVAVVMKMHHALADGGSAVAMLQNAFVTDPASAVVQPYRPESEPSRRELLRLAGRTRAHQVRELPTLGRRTIAGLKAARTASREVGGNPAAPFSGPRTSLNVSLTADRTFAMTALPIPDLLAIKRSVGTTLNGVFLGLCAGALRRYFDGRGELPEKPLVTGVPVGTLQGRPHLSGNHVDNMYVPLPTNVADAVERLRSVHDAAGRARRIREAMGHELLEQRAAMTPLNLYSPVINLWARTHLSDRVRPPINLVASNVPGPREPLTAGGGVISALYSVGPILEGIGLNITAWSYVDALHVAVLGCPASLPDPWALTTAMDAELDDVRDRVL
jgi:diacylglycerol O-acyltransferase